MPFTKVRCANCGAVAEISKSYTIGTKTVHLLKCSHMLMDGQLEAADPSALRSMDNKALFPYQVKGVHFAEEGDGRVLFADEMGVGKTVQIAAFLRLHMDETCPVFIFTKATLKTQWQKELIRWGGPSFIAQIIDGAKDHFIPGLKAYILTYSVARRFVDKVDMSLPLKERIEKAKAGNKLLTQLKLLGVRTIVLDECQNIKNPEAEQTKHVRDLCAEVDHVLAASGTPIKNNASEYFTVLNILKPEMYSVYSHFVYNECDSYWNGRTNKAAGLKYPEQFMEKTKKFIIRRERKDVLPDLPMIKRDFSFHELAKDVAALYEKEMAKFEDEYNSGSTGFERESNLLAYISRMRHLTGISKIDPCIDHVMEFLGSTDRKLVIFTHHIDVAHILVIKLNKLLFELGLGRVCNNRDKIVEEFVDGPARIAVLSTLAAGEGLNLQICSDYIMLERQWNPANEEQAEGRFPRPGSTADKINGTYFVAVGTVDEFFAELVERKREIVNKTLSGKAAPWDQSSLMRDLTERLAMAGKRKWTI